MEGDPSTLPWAHSAQKFNILFVMCKLTDKPLYSSGFGVQFLSHFCAVGNRQIKVINGNEKGCSVNDPNHELQKFNPKKYGDDEVFLDNGTGDFY